MSLFTIYFSSDSDAVPLQVTNTPVQRRRELDTSDGSDNLPSLQRRRWSEVREIAPTDNAPEKPIFKTVTVSVIREKVMHVNGFRTYFRCLLKGEQILIAKMKSKKSKLVPIAAGEEIHLSNPTNYVATMAIENSYTDFTLKRYGKQSNPLLSVQYGAAMGKKEAGRKACLTFLGSCRFPSPLMALDRSKCNIDASWSGDSTKTVIFGDENGNVRVIVQCVGRELLEIVSVLNLSPLWLFGIGMTAFLGKRPTI
jgi:hypothetical protein